MEVSLDRSFFRVDERNESLAYFNGNRDFSSEIRPDDCPHTNGIGYSLSVDAEILTNNSEMDNSGGREAQAADEPSHKTKPREKEHKGGDPPRAFILVFAGAMALRREEPRAGAAASKRSASRKECRAEHAENAESGEPRGCQ